MNMDIDKIRAETPGTANGIHLLAAGSSLMPQPVIDAVINFTKLEGTIGGYEAHAMHSTELDNLYQTVSEHIGAASHEIAITENATIAWCHAFYSIPLAPGSKILTCEAEYAANFVAFLQRAKNENLEIEVIPSESDGTLDVDALESSIDANTGLIAITWIPTNGGLVNPAEKVGKIAKKHNIPYLLDACQALGQMPVDVNRIGCDFLSATGRKFLRGPRGTGFLYVSSKWLDKLEPIMIDLFSATWTSPRKYELREDARKFESWENAYALRLGLKCAIEYADAIGMEHIKQRSWSLAQSCRQYLSDIPGCKMRDAGKTHCAIVSFTIDGLDPENTVTELRKKNIAIGVSKPSSTLLDAQARDLPVLMRAAPHYYNTEDELKTFVHALKSLR